LDKIFVVTTQLCDDAHSSTPETTAGMPIQRSKAFLVYFTTSRLVRSADMSIPSVWPNAIVGSLDTNSGQNRGAAKLIMQNLTPRLRVELETNFCHKRLCL
jgi:hypothetical protein